MKIVLWNPKTQLYFVRFSRITGQLQAVGTRELADARTFTSKGAAIKFYNHHQGTGKGIEPYLPHET